MVLCSYNQEDIDIVLPVCNTQQKFSHDTVMAILIQVTWKNAEDYKLKIDKTLFDSMGTIKSGLFPDDVTPKPVIQIVFVLTSVCRACGHKTHHSGPFTVFDIWFVGLLMATFKHIDEDLASYINLLLSSPFNPMMHLN